MAATWLTERFAFSGGKVLRPGVDGYTGKYPVIKDVLLCGPKSANRRRYSGPAFGPASEKRYEGRPVFIDHGKGERSYRDKIGTIENESRRDDGMPVGDIAVNPKHPQAEQLLWDAEHKPGSCGMSHVAACETRRAADGWDDVTKVAEVDSVDVVVGPATTKGLFEGKTVANKITLRALIERVRPNLKEAKAQKGARLWLLVAEEEDSLASGMMGTEVDDPVDPEAADKPEPEDELWSGFHAACVGFLEKYKAGEMSADEACKEISKYVKAHDKLLSGKGPPDEDDEDDDEEESTPKESKKKGKKLGLADLITEAKGFGLKDPSSSQLQVLEAIATPIGRKAYVEQQLAAAAPEKKPQSTTNTTTKPPAAGATPTTPVTEQRAYPKW